MPVTLSSIRQVGRHLVAVHCQPPDDIALAENEFVADYALEMQDHVHVELAVAIEPLPDLHPADECARIPFAEPVHEHPGAFIEHEEVEALTIGLAVPVWLVLDHGRAAVDAAAGPRGAQYRGLGQAALKHDEVVAATGGVVRSVL